MPEHAGFTSLEGKTSKLKIAGDNVNLGLCDSRDYIANPSLLVQNKFNLTMTFLGKKPVN